MKRDMSRSFGFLHINGKNVPAEASPVRRIGAHPKARGAV
jgi:hypothetical protein